MVQSTSLATAARYEEDAPAASGDYGTLVLGVRNDAGGTLVDANGDYAPFQFNNLGQLIVAIAAIGVIAAVVTQPIHDLLNCNANIQVGDADVAAGNPVPVDVVDNVETTFDHGSNSAIGVAATRFIVAATPAVLGVEVKAANANTANIYIGNADVTAATVDATDGMELGPGESILVRIDDVNKLYAIAAADTQRVFWLRV